MIACPPLPLPVDPACSGDKLVSALTLATINKKTKTNRAIAVKAIVLELRMNCLELTIIRPSSRTAWLFPALEMTPLDFTTSLLVLSISGSSCKVQALLCFNDSRPLIAARHPSAMIKTVPTMPFAVGISPQIQKASTTTQISEVYENGDTREAGMSCSAFVSRI